MNLIEVTDTDLYFNKCSCCKSEEGTKKVVVGSKLITNAFVLCRECREELYNKLKEPLRGENNEEKNI